MTPLILSACFLSLAQPPAAAGLSMNDQPIDTSFLRLYAETRGFMLGRPAKPKFSPDGKTVFFLRSEAKNPKQSLYAFDVASKETKLLLSPEMLLGGKDEQLSAEEKARRERQRITAGGFADYHLSPDGSMILVSLSGRLFVFDRTAETHAELKTGSGSCIDPKWSPDGKMVGYVRGYDVYAFDLASGKETAVTTGGTSIKTNGLAEFVAQEEMGRHSGFWWSPDSKQIAFCEADHTGVEQWAVADPFNPDKLGSPQYYPRPGKKNVSVRLGIATLGSGKVVWVEWDRAKWEYLASVKWDKSAKLSAVLQDRSQQQLLLLQIDPANGKIMELLKESNKTWINLRPELPDWLDEKRFFWQSDRDGVERVYICDIGKNDAVQIRPLTPDRHYVNAFIKSYDPALTDLPTLNVHNVQDPTKNYVWLGVSKSNLQEKLRNIASEGTMNVITTNDLSALCVTFTSFEQLPKTEVFTDSAYLELISNAIEPPIKPTVSCGFYGDLMTAIVKPKNFDPAKKYPVIVDVYGGPRHLHVVQAMKNWLIPQWLADQGFIVVAIDNRGTPGRGREWERAIYQKFGTVPLEDQVKGLQALAAKHPQMDLSRVGIVGWSFGGYMAANAVLRRPDVFHAAVAGAPVTDWEDYDTHYTERYLGVLPESRKAYDEASLIPLAKDLKRPLLLIHGTADDNVYYRHTLKLSDAIFRAGKTCEVLPLPGVTHMYTADPQVAERMWERTMRFFKRELGGVK
jgi:dipeptidyl-peptidase-4